MPTPRTIETSVAQYSVTSIIHDPFAAPAVIASSNEGQTLVNTRPRMTTPASISGRYSALLARQAFADRGRADICETAPRSEAVVGPAASGYPPLVRGE